MQPDQSLTIMYVIDLWYKAKIIMNRGLDFLICSKKNKQVNILIIFFFLIFDFKAGQF